MSDLYDVVERLESAQTKLVAVAESYGSADVRRWRAISAFLLFACIFALFDSHNARAESRETAKDFDQAIVRYLRDLDNVEDRTTKTEKQIKDLADSLRLTQAALEEMINGN